MLRMKLSLATLLLIVASMLCAEDLPEFDRSSVVLRYSGNVSLNHDDARKIFRKSIEILQSSNFNSANPKWEWDEAKINLEYGRAVSGRHVLISFGMPETVKTIGGDIIVRELVIGLNGSQYASSVHTIDSQGKVIGHAKYLGQLCIEIQELANAIASKSPNKTMETTRRFLRSSGHPELTIQECHQCQDQDPGRLTSTASDSKRQRFD